MLKNYPTLQELELLADSVRKALYLIAVGEVKLPEETELRYPIEFPLQWFLEAYCKGDHRKLFYVWDTGFTSMLGKNLVTGCHEILSLPIFSDLIYFKGLNYLKPLKD